MMITQTLVLTCACVSIFNKKSCTFPFNDVSMRKLYLGNLLRYLRTCTQYSTKVLYSTNNKGGEYLV